MAAPFNVEALSALLKAPSKELVEQVFLQAFLNARGLNGVRPERGLGVSAAILKKLGEALELNAVQTEDLLVAVAVVIEDALFENRAATDIVTVLPAELNKNLRQLIAAIVTKNMPKWRETISASQISLPRLVDTDWRVDVKTASEVIARMAQPAIIVDLKCATVLLTGVVMQAMPQVVFPAGLDVTGRCWECSGGLVHHQVQDTAAVDGVLAATRSITFEMNKETLETMLDGLGKIRDQLASITAGTQTS